MGSRRTNISLLLLEQQHLSELERTLYLKINK